ncbi:hypothetical protein KUF54_17095 [Comamonas sp. Y33R10-2]|uniref:hypothetical protein n=1 Tax=Comamonas sp. Y33R10-2 TaxID=2853257 RepID=UPI001C5CA4F7|nr:hypothetical protein [Comamonas sp. Y33R10-2]QXZ09685.1 hypothetical protein KUF54_17095 [Comamonas sp. Y33R10-2]
MRTVALCSNAFKSAATTLAFCTLLAPTHTLALDQSAVPNTSQTQTPELENQLPLNRETLSHAMQTLLQASITRDLETTLKYVAPKKIQGISASMGKSHQDTITELIRIGQAADQRNKVKVITGHYGLDAAQYGSTSTGRSYALQPYSRTFEKDSSTFELTYLTLASVDQGQIFITPLSDETLLPELISLYPDLAEIHVSAGRLGQ